MASGKKTTSGDANGKANGNDGDLNYRDAFREVLEIARRAMDSVHELSAENARLRAEVEAFRSERAAAEISIPDTLEEQRMVLLAVVDAAAHADERYESFAEHVLASPHGNERVREAVHEALASQRQRTGVEQRDANILNVRYWLRNGLKIGDRIRALPVVEKRITEKQICDAIYMWRRRRGRPSVFDETMTETLGLPRNRDEFFVGLFRQLKLGTAVSPITMRRDWAEFSKKNGLR